MDSDIITNGPGPVVGSPATPSSSLSVAEPACNKQRMYIRYYSLSSSPCNRCRPLEDLTMQFHFPSSSLPAFQCAGGVSLHCWPKVKCRRALVGIGVK